MQLWPGVIFVPQMEEPSQKAESVRNNTKFSLTVLNGTLQTLDYLTCIHQIYIRPSVSPSSVRLILLIVRRLELFFLSGFALKVTVTTGVIKGHHSTP